MGRFYKYEMRNCNSTQSLAQKIPFNFIIKTVPKFTSTLSQKLHQTKDKRKSTATKAVSEIMKHFKSPGSCRVWRTRGQQFSQFVFFLQLFSFSFQTESNIIKMSTITLSLQSEITELQPKFSFRSAVYGIKKIRAKHNWREKLL